MSPGIQELAVLFGLAAGIGLVARMLKQPLILAYLLAGVLIGILGVAPVATNPLYELFASLGVMFLLFLIGLEINLDSLRQVGAQAAAIGVGQVTVTFGIGFLINLLLGLSPVAAGFVALAITFSSTIIVVKLLSEKRDLHSLYGKIAIGILLIQDFIAIVLLLGLESFGRAHGINWMSMAATVGKGIALFGLTWWLGRMVMPKLFHPIARSPELLFTVSLAWLFGVAAIVQQLGFSIEIGGFLAGLALANSSEHFQISSRVKPLRDFFLLLFFIVLGSSLVFADLGAIAWPAIVLSLFVLVGQPLIVLWLMQAMGYHKRTGFFTGITIAQISEFSLVLMALAQRHGYVTPAEVTLVTVVGVLTISLSSYLILYGDRLYHVFRPWLRSGSNQRETKHRPEGIRRSIVLFGAHRTGQSILTHAKKEDVVIVDFNPDLISYYKKLGYASVYGEMNDPDMFEAIDLRAVRVIISTNPNGEENLQLLNHLHRLTSRRSPLVIMRAETQDDARRLYAQGADYVILPHVTAGHSIGQLVVHGLTAAKLQQLQRHDERSRRLTPEIH